MPQLVKAKVGTIKRSATSKNAADAAVASVAPPPELPAESGEQLAGCGLLLEKVDDHVFVKMVVAGGAAHDDGRISRGDQVTHVNRAEIAELPLEEVREHANGLCIHFASTRALADSSRPCQVLELIKGKEGTSITMTILREDTTVDVDLVRKKIAGKVAPQPAPTPEVHALKSDQILPNTNEEGPPLKTTIPAPEAERDDDSSFPLKTTIPAPEAERAYPNSRMPVRARSGLKSWVNGEAKDVPQSVAKSRFQAVLHKISDDEQPHGIAQFMELSRIVRKKADNRRRGMPMYATYGKWKSFEMKLDSEDNAPLRPAPKNEEVRGKYSRKVGDLSPFQSDSSEDDVDPDEESSEDSNANFDPHHTDSSRAVSSRAKRVIRLREGRNRIAAARGYPVPLSAHVDSAARPNGQEAAQRARMLLPDPESDEEPALSIQLLPDILRTAQEVSAEWLDYDPSSNSWATKSVSVRKALLDSGTVPSHLSVRESNSNR